VGEIGADKLERFFGQEGIIKEQGEQHGHQVTAIGGSDYHYPH